MTVTALELIISIGASINVNGATERAYNDFTPSLFSDEITATLFTVEVIDKRDKRIEMFKFKFKWRIRIWRFKRKSVSNT